MVPKDTIKCYSIAASPSFNIPRLSHFFVRTKLSDNLITSSRQANQQEIQQVSIMNCLSVWICFLGMHFLCFFFYYFILPFLLKCFPLCLFSELLSPFLVDMCWFDSKEINGEEPIINTHKCVVEDNSEKGWVVFDVCTCPDFVPWIHPQEWPSINRFKNRVSQGELHKNNHWEVLNRRKCVTKIYFQLVEKVPVESKHELLIQIFTQYS